MSNNPYQPGVTPGGNHPGAGPKPNNFLIPAIFSTLCCCIPFGVVSIVFAAQVDSKWAQGDYAGAHKSAASAKMWFFIALGLGILGGIISFGLQIALLANNPNF